MAGHLLGRGFESLHESLSVSFPLFLSLYFFLTDFDMGWGLTFRSVVCLKSEPVPRASCLPHLPMQEET